MSSSKETMPLDQQAVAKSDQTPKKTWETPKFELYDVASMTRGKSNNSNETNGVVGPLS